MSDIAVQWIQEQINASEKNQNQLWLLDENHLGLIQVNQDNHPIQVISNRWDLYQEAKQKNYSAVFNDFDLSAITDESLNNIFYRVSKEKPLVHHLINHAWRCLKPQGNLIITGYKQEGTKTYIEKTANLFGDSQKAVKLGQIYTARLSKSSRYHTDHLLDDQDYSYLQPVININNKNYFSKPGLFGWNKIDQGSQLLIQHLHQLALDKKLPKNCLDLGCGYGYLTLAAAQHADCQSIQHWTLTDNNAAAIKAAEHNMSLTPHKARVIADDAGRSIHEKFELILCNPPFHQGFQADRDLTEKFVQQAHKLLATQGQAFFVVNQFVSLESKASGLFKSVHMLHQQGGFKLFLLKNY